MTDKHLGQSRKTGKDTGNLGSVALVQNDVLSHFLELLSQLKLRARMPLTQISSVQIQHENIRMAKNKKKTLENRKF